MTLETEASNLADEIFAAIDRHIYETGEKPAAIILTEAQRLLLGRYANYLGYLSDDGEIRTVVGIEVLRDEVLIRIPERTNP